MNEELRGFNIFWFRESRFRFRRLSLRSGVGDESLSRQHSYALFNNVQGDQLLCRRFLVRESLCLRMAGKWHVSVEEGSGVSNSDLPKFGKVSEASLHSRPSI